MLERLCSLFCFKKWKLQSWVCKSGKYLGSHTVWCMITHINNVIWQEHKQDLSNIVVLYVVYYILQEYTVKIQRQTRQAIMALQIYECTTWIVDALLFMPFSSSDYPVLWNEKLIWFLIWKYNWFSVIHPWHWAISKCLWYCSFTHWKQ